jgi:hypothetical protein
MITHASVGIFFKVLPRFLWVTLTFAVAICPSRGQSATPPSDPRAIQFAAQALLAITSSQTIKDLALTGQATWNAGEQQNGTVTLMASGSEESRFDVALSGARAPRFETRLPDSRRGSG